MHKNEEARLEKLKTSYIEQNCKGKKVESKGFH